MHKTLKLTGVVIKADTPSISGRVYPAEELKKALERSELPTDLRLYSGSSFNDYKEVGEVNSVSQSSDGDIEASVSIDFDKMSEEDLKLINQLFLTPYGQGMFSTGTVAEYSLKGVVVSGIHGWEGQPPAHTEKDSE